MTTPDQGKVRELLLAFEPRLRAVVDRGWREWMDLGLAGRFIFGRVQSNIVFDFIARHAISEFADDPDIHVIPKNCSVKFLFRDQVLVRFKKANASGVGSNIETTATLDFIDPQREFPDFLKEVYKIEVCYQTDRLGAEIDEVAIVARDRKTRIWAYALDPAHTENVVQLPRRDGDVAPPVVSPRAKPLDEAEE